MRICIEKPIAVHIGGSSVSRIVPLDFDRFAVRKPDVHIECSVFNGLLEEYAVGFRRQYEILILCRLHVVAADPGGRCGFHRIGRQTVDRCDGLSDQPPVTGSRVRADQRIADPAETDCRQVRRSRLCGSRREHVDMAVVNLGDGFPHQVAELADRPFARTGVDPGDRRIDIPVEFFGGNNVVETGKQFFQHPDMKQEILFGLLACHFRDRRRSFRRNETALQPEWRHRIGGFVVVPDTQADGRSLDFMIAVGDLADRIAFADPLALLEGYISV